MLYIVTPVPFLHDMAVGNDSLWPSGAILSHELLVIIAFGSVSSSTGGDFWSVRPSFKKICIRLTKVWNLYFFKSDSMLLTLNVRGPS